jgi:hypothetical protein
MKKTDGVVILSEENRTARMTFSVAVASSLRVSGQTVTPEILQSYSSLKPAGRDGGGAVHSLFFDTNVSVDSGARGPKFETIDDVKPKETDYVFPLFRALSQTLITGHWIDFTKPGVLEESVPLLQGQTVFKNHDYEDVEKWLGVVNQAVWDPKGEGAGEVPGINVELKIDWKVNPIIARGLLMTPPAIHSVSVTVLTEWEYSHPQMAAESKWKFYENLGEEIDGEIVRFIVTKIVGYWEISLVFQGADLLAKNAGVAEESRQEFRPAAIPPSLSSTATTTTTAALPATDKTKETLTVKLTAAQKKALGLEAIEGEEVAEHLVLASLDKLAQAAANGEALMAAAREDCLRFAVLAELGTAEGNLPNALTTLINGASGETLTELSEMYRKKAEARFTATCQSCGSTNIDSRSSVEALANEGNPQTAASKVTSANSLH